MRDGTNKLSATTIGLHWLLAVAMIAMLAFGLVLEDMPRGEAKTALMWWHKGLGVAILAFAAWRLGWRMVNGLPSLPGRRTAGWQESVGLAVHWFLLLGTLVMPISGIVLSLAGGKPVDVLGLFTVAAWPKNETLHEVGEAIHGLGGKLLILAIVLHVAGALKHHLVDRDGTLRRMLGASVPADTTATAQSR